MAFTLLYLLYLLLAADQHGVTQTAREAARTNCHVAECHLSSIVGVPMANDHVEVVLLISAVKFYVCCNRRADYLQNGTCYFSLLNLNGK